MHRDADDPLAGWFDEPASGDRHSSGRRTSDDLPGDPPSAPSAAADEEGGGSSLRRPLVVVGLAAAVLWTAAAVVGLGADARGAAADASPGAAPSTVQDRIGPEPSRSAEPFAAASAAHGAVRATADPASPLSSPVGPGAAAAVVALHDLESSASRWVDVAVVETAEPLAVPEPATNDVVLLARLHAVVLDGDGERWTTQRRARYALPVACGAQGCRELADPWPLAVHPGAAPTGDDAPADADGPEGSDAPLEPAPRADQGPSAHATDGSVGTGDQAADTLSPAQALRRAGYRDVEVAATTELWPGVVAVDVRALAPGEDLVDRHVVWVQVADGAGSARVLGADP